MWSESDWGEYFYIEVLLHQASPLWGANNWVKPEQRAKTRESGKALHLEVSATAKAPRWEWAHLSQKL